jgi:galactonate dehydratase
MRIDRIEPAIVHVNHRGDWVFVLVHTDSGITGLGEASHSGNDALLIETLDLFAEQLRGRSAHEIQSIWQQLCRFDGGRVSHTALSGIEQALWDIVGQELDAPIHTLFGSSVRDQIRLYANINRHVTDRTPEGFARAALEAVEQGFGAIKIAPFDELRSRDHVRTGPAAAWQMGVARVKAVRSAIGPKTELAVDCHRRMDPSEAVIVAEALAEYNLMWYEEPVAHRFEKELARITRSVPMPTASAESVFALEGFRPFLTEHIVDVLMPDVKHAGGLMETMNIANAARMSNCLIAPHNPSGPVATVATGHIVSTMSNFAILEYAWGEVDWRADLIIPPEPVRDGYLRISDKPGLGYRLDPEVLKRHRRTTPSATDSTKVVIHPS